jgi:hypothetical protein
MNAKIPQTITVMAMHLALTQMDLSPALVTLDTVAMEYYVSILMNAILIQITVTVTLHVPILTVDSHVAAMMVTLVMASYVPITTNVLMKQITVM